MVAERKGRADRAAPAAPADRVGVLLARLREADARVAALERRLVAAQARYARQYERAQRLQDHCERFAEHLVNCERRLLEEREKHA